MSFLGAAAPLRFLSWPLIRLPWSTTPKRAARPNAPLHSGFQKLTSEPGTTVTDFFAVVLFTKLAS